MQTYLMCPPEHFTVSYAINPWMSTDEPVDHDRAVAQWTELKDTYERLGHTVRLIDPVAGLPDMVFAANGATVIDGTVLGARFRHPERAAEGPAYMDWFRANGYGPVRAPRFVNEGEGDLIHARGLILAGYGFRTDRGVKDELEEVFGLPVVSLRLVNPHFYHLDTALCVLNDDVAAYFPPAFDDEGRAALASVFHELIEAKESDAEVLGLNGVSDGHHVVLPAQADALADRIATAGFTPIGIDLSEFRKSGGGPKCCTLELRPAREETL